MTNETSWLFNTDETEEVGVGKHELMLKQQLVAAWGHCRGVGAEATLNRPLPGDYIYYFRAGFGIVARAVATHEFSYATNSIFHEVGEFCRDVEQVQVLSGEPITVREIKNATNYQIPYRQIMARLLDPDAINYLIKRFKKTKLEKVRTRSKNHKGSFAIIDAERRTKIERAAIKFVTEKYERDGWHVHSVEKENVGYDLHCTRGKEVECAEVKGTSSSIEQFVITANEFEKSISDKRFVLHVVVNALSEPRLTTYRHAQIPKNFDLTPIQYRAVFRQG